VYLPNKLKNIYINALSHAIDRLVKKTNWPIGVHNLFHLGPQELPIVDVPPQPSAMGVLSPNLSYYILFIHTIYNQLILLTDGKLKIIFYTKTL
jgi:hypothetical protein